MAVTVKHYSVLDFVQILTSALPTQTTVHPLLCALMWPALSHVTATTGLKVLDKSVMVRHVLVFVLWRGVNSPKHCVLSRECCFLAGLPSGRFDGLLVCSGWQS